MSKLTWKRDGRGRQVSTDGNWAVESDGYGYISQADREGSGVAAGVTGGEWAAIDLTRDKPRGLNMDWFPTMREAKAYCEGGS